MVSYASQSCLIGSRGVDISLNAMAAIDTQSTFKYTPETFRWREN